MLRYVILEHDFPSLHWDLMLEAGSVLRTWRLPAPPRLGETIFATAATDHRLLYLDYEGPISGERGQVLRWDSGRFFELSRDEDRLIVRLEGERLAGILELSHKQGEQWSCAFREETAKGRS